MTDETLTLATEPPMPGCTICAHAWTETPDGDSEYAEPETDGAQGCAYLRTPDDETGTVYPGGGGFDVPNETDFASFAEAERFALAYAERHGVPAMIY